MNINIESEIMRVIDIEMKGLSILKEQIDSSVKNAYPPVMPEADSLRRANQFGQVARGDPRGSF